LACLSTQGTPNEPRPFYRFTVFMRILAFLEANNVYDQFDPNVDGFSPPNLATNSPRTAHISAYVCPSDPAAIRTINFGTRWGQQPADQTLGNYGYAVSVDGYHNATGPPCTFDNPAGRPRRRPAIYVGADRSLADITDGTSNTLIFSEMKLGPHTSAAVDGNADLRGQWSADFGCSFTGMLSPNSSAPDECLTNCTDDPANGTPAILSFPYWGHWANAARSSHPGGVNACMVDGSVHFVSNNIDVNLWQALISANGADVAANNHYETAPTLE
jgi:prepilin-type processing-associated H-X9-DG protein